VASAELQSIQSVGASMKNKNALVIALLLGFVVAWQYFIVTPYQLKHAPPPVKKTEQATAPVDSNSGSSMTSQPTVAQLDPVAPADVESFWTKAHELSLTANRRVFVRKDGTLGSPTFADYFERERKEKTPVRFLDQGLRLNSDNAAVRACLAQLSNQEVSSQGITLKGQASGVICQVQYLVDGAKPGLVSAKVDLKGDFGRSGSLLITLVGVPGKGADIDRNYFHYQLDGSDSKLRDSDLHEEAALKGKLDWTVWGDRYFASAVVPRGVYNPNLRVVATDKASPVTPVVFEYPLSVIATGQDLRIEWDAFFGPRDVESLEAVQVGMGRAVDFGFFPRISQGLLWCLKQINRLFDNFGVSIIVLTLLVRLLFWPLNKKVYASGIKMKALQPEMERIKQKYAGDKSRATEMNMETLALYKKHKVNPVGSCFPLLLQMPIFFGLYGALNHSLDLFQAPFFMWITDLSSRDPFFVFPALWTISLVAYVFLNPMPQNNQQGMPDMKWIMISMNIFFGYLSKDWPAGLTLYLFVSNLVGITQQMVMQRATKKLQPIQEGA
jgi:YidC/Oxa1 family membrane protein insertase